MGKWIKENWLLTFVAIAWFICGLSVGSGWYGNTDFSPDVETPLTVRIPFGDTREFFIGKWELEYKKKRGDGNFLPIIQKGKFDLSFTATEEFDCEDPDYQIRVSNGTIKIMEIYGGNITEVWEKDYMDLCSSYRSVVEEAYDRFGLELEDE